MPVKMSETKTAKPNENAFVYLDVKIGEEKVGRMVIELYKSTVPKTAENFRALCTGEKGIGKMGKPLHYKGCIFHRAIPQFLVQSGDITSGDGSGGESIYGPNFVDENFIIKHSSEGIVGMANCGPNTNNSQFYITAVPCSHLDGRNVAFGKVVKGLNILTEIYGVSTQDDKPLEFQKKCVIEDCGEFASDEPWQIEERDLTQDVYPPWPNDWDEDPSESDMEEVIEKIKDSGNYYYRRQNFIDSDRKYKKALRYIDWLLTGNRNCDVLKINSLKINSLLNLAAVRLKKCKYKDVVDICDQVIHLDAENCKAYYRRGQAKVGLLDYSGAIRDLQMALNMCPHDRNIMSKLEMAKKMKLDYYNQEKSVCLKIFDIQ